MQRVTTQQLLKVPNTIHSIEKGVLLLFKSTQMPSGTVNLQPAARYPSPLKPATPVPAIVVTIDVDNDTFRIT